MVKTARRADAVGRKKCFSYNRRIIYNVLFLAHGIDDLVDAFNRGVGRGDLDVERVFEQAGRQGADS